MALTKGFARNNAKTPLDQRQADMATIVANADGSPRVGVLSTTIPTLVSHGGGMNLAVAAAEFVTSKGKADGVMIYTNDGLVNVTIGAAPASNSRIDVIWTKHEDNTTGDAASLPIFGVTAGVAAASPTKPAIPTGALELATLRVYSGTVATNGGANVLTNTFQVTLPRGGVVPFRTKADLDLWTNPAAEQRALVLDTRIEYRWIGGAWKPWESEWIAFTPASSTITVGAGTALTRYRYVAGRVLVHYRYSIGSGGTITGGAVVSLPVAREALGHSYEVISELGNAYDASVTTNFRFSVLADGNSANAVRFGYGLPQINTDVTNATPFPLNSADVYSAMFFYDPA